MPNETCFVLIQVNTCFMEHGLHNVDLNPWRLRHKSSVITSNRLQVVPILIAFRSRSFIRRPSTVFTYLFIGCNFAKLERFCFDPNECVLHETRSSQFWVERMVSQTWVFCHNHYLRRVQAASIVSLRIWAFLKLVVCCSNKFDFKEFFFQLKSGFARLSVFHLRISSFENETIERSGHVKR